MEPDLASHAHEAGLQQADRRFGQVRHLTPCHLRLPRQVPALQQSLLQAVSGGFEAISKADLIAKVWALDARPALQQGAPQRQADSRVCR